MADSGIDELSELHTKVIKLLEESQEYLKVVIRKERSAFTKMQLEKSFVLTQKAIDELR